jgi:DNA-binding CsgD family transcriptional regulator
VESARQGLPSAGKLDLLSPREREVLQLIAEGHSTEEIAGLIYRSPETVRSHRMRIMNKLDLHSVAQLVRFAFDHGLLPSNGSRREKL